MTDYKTLKGKRVKTFATDLDNDQAEGQIFYQSTAGKFKTAVSGAAWSSTSSLLNARDNLGGFGVRDSSVIYGGSPNSTEEYNGSGFSSGGALNTARATCQDNGWGVETAGVVASGSVPGNTANVEEYNGSSFSEVNNVSTARRQQASIGLVQTAGAICGGYSTANTDATEEYDGTNWTSGGDLSTSRRGFAGSGTLTAGIVFSGYSTTVVANTEEYDGTSWTAAASINTARNNGIGASNAPQSTALLFGGNTGSETGKTEQYNGTSWTEVSDMGTARDGLGGSGIGTSALAAGGAPPPGDVAIAEEFNTTVNTITAGAWASGGAMNTGRGTAGDCGTYLAGLVFGGNPGNAPYADDKTEEYNGTSWSESGDLAHASSDASGAGTQTAAVAFGLSASPNTITQHYDGTSWTTVPGTLPTAQSQARGLGTQTAALSCGGGGTEGYEYDGTSWTDSGDLNTARQGQKPGGWGIQTAAIIASGRNPPSTLISNTETYNGTAWTETGNSILTAVKRTSATTAGTNSDGMINGGGFEAGTNNSIAAVQAYNGTTWFTQPSLATHRLNLQGFGTSTNAVACGGDTYPGGPVGRDATEEFTGETTSINLKTITDS
jgi:hypothetical protein